VCKNTKPHSQFSILAILDESICTESNDNRLYRRISLDRNRRHLFLHSLGQIRSPALAGSSARPERFGSRAVSNKSRFGAKSGLRFR
jgi:hypothetical protein